MKISDLFMCIFEMCYFFRKLDCFANLPKLKAEQVQEQRFFKIDFRAQSAPFLPSFSRP
jgi:hypothetical protein